MRSRAIVEGQVASKRYSCLTDAAIGTQIHLLVFDLTPEPFDEDIVAPTSAAVHADGNPVLHQLSGECGAGELARLKWSLQHLEGGGCDDEAQAAFGSVWSGAIVLTRSSAGGRTRGAATVLGGDRGRCDE